MSFLSIGYPRIDFNAREIDRASYGDLRQVRPYILVEDPAAHVEVAVGRPIPQERPRGCDLNLLCQANHDGGPVGRPVLPFLSASHALPMCL
jgi:hypothetical protein